MTKRLRDSETDVFGEDGTLCDEHGVLSFPRATAI